VAEEAPAFTAWREYSPGLWTALTGFLPTWAYVSRVARREDLITSRRAVAAAAIGGVVHAVAVAPLVFTTPAIGVTGRAES